jgi:transcriptional regulator GlxA family with amidase domain
VPVSADGTQLSRRGFLGLSAAAVAAGAGAPGALAAAPVRPLPLPLPRGGTIRTAFAIGPGFNVIDVAGAWEVFQDAVVANAGGRFELFTVAPSTDPVVGTAGLTVTPSYAYGTAPQPHVVVIPAHGATPATVAWVKRVARRADLVMSVCTGAFVLAETGLLDGRTATTHHGSWDDFAAAFPKVRLVRNRRYVEHAKVATAGGLTSGIDLALRVVERYLGRPAADATARYMEYTRAPLRA